MEQEKQLFLRLAIQYLLEVQTILEPVATWQDNNYGQSLLSNFYENPERWAYTFELFTMICRVQEHLKEQKENSSVKIFERSLYSGYYCFAHNSYAQGFMSEIEWHLYEQWFSFLIPTSANRRVVLFICV